MKKILLSIAAVLTLLSTASYALASTAQFQVNTLSGGSLTTSLISYYPMSGNSNDYWGTNNGTDTSVTYGTSYGKVAQGALFGGSSVITLSAYPTFGTGNFSIFNWVKTSVTGTRKGMVSWGGNTTNNGVNLFINTSNHLEFDLSFTVGPAGSVNIADGNWHLVGVVNTGGSMQLYTDGSADGSAVGMSPNITTGGSKEIGADLSPTYMNGDIDELGIWSKVLSTTEITDLYNGGAGQTMCNGTGGPLCQTPRRHQIVLNPFEAKFEHFNYV